LARLREVEPALARLVVQRLADDAAGGPASGVARRAAEILALDEHGTVQLDTGGGVVAFAEYGVLRFESRASRSAQATPEPVLLAIPGSAVFGGQQVTCELGPPAREPGVLDRSTLGDDLLVRSWRPGDRMAPLGLPGSKSLQDLFTARRVPRRERGGVPVVESEGEIVWVAGVATSERFKVTDATAEAVRLSVRPERPPRS
jgi:tRNA(Ile)-lysidine synthase